MATLYAQRVKFETLRRVSFGDVSSSFVELGTPFEDPCRIIKIFNSTDTEVEISFNGTDPHDSLAAGSGVVYDYGSNMSLNAGNLEQDKMTQAWVQDTGVAASSGSVTLTIIYAG